MGMVLTEENYKEQMDQVLVPYNQERETDTYVERTEGEKLHLCIYQADDAKGSVVISHGFTESIVKYQEVIYYFLNAGYHVSMPEHCGHGKSYRMTIDKSLVHIDTYKRYVDDLLFVAHLCKDEYPDLPMYLYAHSMGGGIGACVLAAEPELFTKAILTSPMIRPESGGIPWGITRFIANAMSVRGRDEDYIPGQKPYDNSSTFESSCGTSEARFDYYKEKVEEDESLQTCACSYAWIREAANMNRYLIRTGWRKVRIPVLLMQAEKEDLVSKSEHHHYIRMISKLGNGNVSMVLVPESKHEIFNATAEIQEKYWKKVFRFFQD